ncbi:MAG: hypothetical protein AAF772_16800, partial [Acidobacteriota bacterium]
SVAAVSVPSSFPGFFPTHLLVEVTNNGEAPATATLMTAIPPTGWIAIPMVPFLTIPGESTMLMPIMVHANCGSAGQSESIAISVISNAYGETFTASTTGTVNCI